VSALDVYSTLLQEDNLHSSRDKLAKLDWSGFQSMNNLSVLHIFSQISAMHKGLFSIFLSDFCGKTGSLFPAGFKFGCRALN
jgi:hypothetical protein